MKKNLVGLFLFLTFLIFSPSRAQKDNAISVNYQDTIETQASQNTHWAKTYDLSDLDNLGSVIECSNGDFIVVATTVLPNQEKKDAWILCLNQLGEIKWQRIYGGEDFDSGGAILQTSDSSYIVSGSTSSFGAGGLDAWILKLDPAGEIEWQNTYGGKERDNAGILQAKDGGYFLAGNTDS